MPASGGRSQGLRADGANPQGSSTVATVAVTSVIVAVGEVTATVGEVIVTVGELIATVGP